MIKVGVTGGMGSGKSTVCSVFELLGIPVYYADDRAKQLMSTDALLVKAITQAFGQNSYIHGQLNRAYLAEKVFGNEHEVSRLNALVHPAVQRDFELWAEQQLRPYVIKEAALIYEAGSDRYLDKVIVVTADEEERVTRIMNRDKVTRESVLSRMKHQWPQSELVSRADFLVDNGGARLVIPQVLEIHERIIERLDKDGDTTGSEVQRPTR